MPERIVSRKLVEELEALEKAATKGPWVACIYDAMERPHVFADDAANNKLQHSHKLDIPRTDEDSQFVATSRNALPSLLATVREMADALQHVYLELDSEGHIVNCRASNCAKCGAARAMLAEWRRDDA